MAPKKVEKKTKGLTKTKTMMETAAAGQEFLKKVWGEEKLNQVNEMLDARDKTESTTVDPAPAATSSTVTSSSASTSSAPETTSSKPTLSKARTMKNTAKEAKALIGKEVLGETRSETKRRQAAVNAKKALEEVTKPTAKRKTALKRAGTMKVTAREGKAFVKRTSAKAAKGKKSTGKKRS